MTPQDIREQSFEKAVFGGFDMGAVESFLGEVADEFEAIYKDNMTLRAKMKVLVDKIEEYRRTEDSMRLALDASRRIALEMEEKAKSEAESLLENAKIEALEAREKLQRENEEAEQMLLRAKESVASYFENARALCVNQLDLLDRLSESKAFREEPTRIPVSEPIAAPAEPEEVKEEELEEEQVFAPLFSREEESYSIPEIPETPENTEEDFTRRYNMVPEFREEEALEDQTRFF
jgi:cell division initiation protein